MSDFSGIWVALITPFHDDTVDHAALRRLIAHYRAAGVHGLVALGSTGEASALSEAEQDAVLDTVLSEADALGVIAGLAAPNTAQVLHRCKALNRLPLAGVLSPAPAYVRPSQAGLIEHFTRLADVSESPVVLYDIPYRTGVPLALDTLLHLAAHEQIRALKDCGGSLDKTQALVADGRLAVLAGEDGNIFHSLCLGGQGAITAAAHLQPERFVALYDAVRAGRLAEARALHHELMPMIRALFAEPNPSVIKAVLAQQGWCRDELRLPMVSASEAARANWGGACHGHTPTQPPV